MIFVSQDPQRAGAKVLRFSIYGFGLIVCVPESKVLNLGLSFMRLRAYSSQSLRHGFGFDSNFKFESTWATVPRQRGGVCQERFCRFRSAHADRLRKEKSLMMSTRCRRF